MINQRIIPVGCVFHLLVEGHQGLYSVFFGIFVAEEIDGAGNTTTVDVQSVWEAF
jgi:hypothetical protein